MNPRELREKIGQLLAGQKLAVLSTCGGDGPYASLVAFACSSDLRCLYFATTRATRKYANLMHLPRVAFLIDNRTYREDDVHRGAAVTVLGWAEEFAAQEKQNAAASFLDRHPDLQEFVASPTTAFFSVRTENYIYAANFRNVFELRMEKHEGKKCI